MLIGERLGVYVYVCEFSGGMGEQVLVIHCIIDDVRRDMTSYDISPDPQVLDHLILKLDILCSYLVFFFRIDNCILRALTTLVERI